ncbi:MAG: hypothetical protein NTY19_40850 [Planctomycetota bacterium]|nr:hypothetical protein [Planctomycetota bacterium]
MKKSLLAIVVVLSWGVVAWSPAGESARPRVRRSMAVKQAEERAPYDSLFQVYVPTFADAIVSKVKQASQQDVNNRRPGESDEDFAIRKQFVEGVAASITKGVKELENVSLGWRLDKQDKRTYFDLTVTALKDTSAAQELAQLSELKTAFRGFAAPDAVVTAHWTGQTPKHKTEVAVKLIQALRDKELKKIDNSPASADEITIRKDLLNKLLDVIRDSAASGHSDGGVSLVIQPNDITLVAGGYVADGAKLESVVKPIATWLQQSHPLFAGLKLDVEKVEGVNFHTLSIPAPQGNDREKFVQLFGESLEVVVGFGPEAVYLSAGKQAVKSLKDAIQKSAKPAKVTAPFELSVALKPLADFVSVMGKEQEKGPAQLVAGVLAQAPGKDHLRVVAQPIERGVILRLDAEEGILQLLGAANPEVQAFLLGK